MVNCLFSFLVMDTVLSDPGLLNLIMAHLDCFTLSRSCTGVSKLFHGVCTDLIPRKIIDEIVVPVQNTFERYIRNIRDMTFEIDFDTDLKRTLCQSMHYVIELIDTYELCYWALAFQCDSVLRDKLFYHLTFLNQMYTYYQNVYIDRIIDEQLHEKVRLRFDKVKPHLFVHDAEKYTAEQLREMNRFKNQTKETMDDDSNIVYWLLQPLSSFDDSEL